ncbi:MAG: transposase [Candidatus Aenigmarchaeota archaeon]|nr:transposase [Candidatus Aenigmarchaeota archaeon]
MSGDEAKKKKQRTPINWKVYNKQLKNRGKNLANCMKSLKASNQEKEIQLMNNGKNGHPFEYTDTCVILLAILKSVTGLGYVMTTGIATMFLDKVMSSTQLFRRVNALPEKLFESLNRRITKSITKGKDEIDIILDGTGIMINGTFAWIDEKTGEKRARDWKKIHLVVERKSKAILVLEVIDKHKNEAENESMKNTVLNAMDAIDENTQIKRAFGDGLYDSYDNFEMMDSTGIELVARIREPTINIAKSLLKSKVVSDKSLRRFKAFARNRAAIEQTDWKRYVREHNFGLRGGIEGIIGAFKRLFGEYAYARSDESRAKEFLIKQMAWNVMRLG